MKNIELFNSKNNPEPKKENLIKKNMRKIVGIGAITLASLTPKESIAQINNQTKDKLLPDKTWQFVGDDKFIARAPSKKFPGFMEYYQKHNLAEFKKDNTVDTTTYFFNGYMDEDENYIRTPDSIEAEILKKEIELSQYSNPEAYAQKEFEFQKTDDFKKKVDQDEISTIEDRINTDKFLLNSMEEQGDTTDITYRKEELKRDEYSLESYIKFHDIHFPRVLKEKTKTYDGLVEYAIFEIKKINKELSDLKKEYEDVTQYITKHSK